MFYEILKVFNNNVVLIKNSDGQCVLISKGVGFSQKIGDTIDISKIEQSKKFFYTENNQTSKSTIKKLEFCMKTLNEITQDIIDDAFKTLDIKNDSLFNGIFDHIVFVVESLKANIPINNPFINEIKLLCAEEFEIADRASKKINDKLNILLNDGEKALIALHLHSAKTKQTITSVTVDIMIYSKILNLLEDAKYTNESYRSFILSVNSLISACKNSHNYVLSEDFIKSTESELGIYFEKALKIANLLYNELEIHEISSSFVALLTIEVYKLYNF